MYPTINDKLKDTPYTICLAVTGGGTGVIDKMLKYGGGSSTLLDAYVPYDVNRLSEFLGNPPAKCCHMDTARDMAMEAYKRACKGHSKESVLGVGATCKLRKVVNERQGREHTIHIAIQGYEFTETFDFVLGPTASTIRLREMGRVEEEDLCSDTIMMCIAVSSGLNEYKDRLNELYGNDFTHNKAVDLYGAKEVLFNGATKVGLYKTKPSQFIFPGSYNPIHEGHLEMIDTVINHFPREEGSLEPKVDLEISIHNVDKAPMDYLDIAYRMGKLSFHSSIINNVWLTDAPTFALKSDIFKGASFIVGGDTIVRVDDNQYYASEGSKISTFKQYKKDKTHFIAMNRNGSEIKDLSPDLMKITSIVEAYQDKGYSSTAIRESQK
jgi:hypothetical protein